MGAQPKPTERVRRALRRDALENREKMLAVAAKLIAIRGLNVPLADIAAAAGLGIGSFYRAFPDRTALLRALELRAYKMIIVLLDRIEQSGQAGAIALETFFEESLAVRDQLVLPLRGAPPFIDDEAIEARAHIDAVLGRLLADGRADGSIAVDVNGTDVIICGAMITQPLPSGPGWSTLARRHASIFLRGLIAHPESLPGPPVTANDVETMFRAIANT